MDFSVCDRLPTDVKIEHLIEDAVDFACSNGILMKADDGFANGKFCKQFCIHTPFTLFPSPFPKSSLEYLMELQPHVNKVMHLASQDEEFMTENLKGISEVDDFVRNLLDIYKTVKSSDRPNIPELALIRSDYMLNYDQKTCENNIKQLEVNICGVSHHGNGAQQMKQLHEHTLKRAGMTDLLSRLPDNYASSNAAKVFAKAWRMYGNPEAVIVFLVKEGKKQIYDERLFEYEIVAQDPSIRTSKKTMSEMARDMKVDNDGRLFVDDLEVAVVYFRTGDDPDHYKSEKIWEMRLDIEKSRAIKCPSVAHQLMDMKKMQEILARPGQLERFVDKEIAEKIRNTFVGFQALDMREAGDAAVKKALEDPKKYVLKPQREGGDFNFYDEDLEKLLQEIGNNKQRSAYILMDKIRPKSNRNYIISSGTATMTDVIQEIGIFSTIITNGKGFEENNTVGHIIRAKSKGRGAVGPTALDSPLLIDI